MRVGGLPLHPKPPLNYQEVFSLEGLINEYVEPAKILKDGRLTAVESMGGLEEIRFPEPFGEMEAFYTSGGAAALPEMLKGKVKELDYKTVRYPGHAEKIRSGIEMGLASQKEIAIGNTKVTPRAVWIKLLSELLPKTGPDVILLRVWLDGVKAGQRMRLIYDMVEKADSKFTAMMKATAYPASVIALLLARGEIPQTGALCQEEAVPLKKFIAELEARGLRIQTKLEAV
jgi:lysine 6-dehydrogenase